MEKKRFSEFMRENRHIWFLLIFGCFYLITFVLLENSNAAIHLIHSEMDDKIPFCEYFIVPYVLWYFYVALTACWFAFKCKDRREYYQFSGVLCVGMAVFLIVSFVYPNGHDLRPAYCGDNIFAKAVSVLYKVDTSTNILPSLHVFMSIACASALLENQEIKKKKGVSAGIIVLTVSIVAATMLIKQHSVIDVAFAIVLNLLCYELFYRIAPRHEIRLRKLFTKKEICTIPNYLSCFRLFLAVMLAGFLFRWDMEAQRGWMIFIVALSGISDFLDGKIARKYNMISEVGKILDPVADKLTQGVLLLCFMRRYPLVRSMFVLFVIKEAFSGIMGLKTIVKTGKNDGAMWYGKISTTVFYGVMIVLLFGVSIPEQAAEGLLWFSAFWMAVSFVMYIREYQTKLKKTCVEQKCMKDRQKTVKT